MKLARMAMSGGVFGVTIAANTSNVNIRTLAVASGWNQSFPLTVTINAGVQISGSAALVVSGSFPGGVSVINNGVIYGYGGSGGPGGTASSTPMTFGGTGNSGNSGGDGLSVSSPVNFTNNGVICAGGGGGGGGGSCQDAGYAPLNGGSGGNGADYYTSASSGSAGQVSGPNNGGTGGAGGAVGVGGTGGASGNGNYFTLGGGSSAAGNAVSGNSNITWLATGTRIGTIA